jgi:hypothetical protein
MQCPKCKAVQTSDTICTACGLVFEKYRERQAFLERAQDEKARLLTELFSDAHSFRIQQSRNLLEIVTPFEIGNRYEVTIHGRNSQSAMVRECSRSVLNVILRHFLGHIRPADLVFENIQGREAFTMKKRFRFFFHHVDVFDVDGTLLGTVSRQFTLLNDTYVLQNAKGRTLMTLKGPFNLLLLVPFIAREYRFELGGRELGRITKQWRGLLSEYFLDADNFEANVDAALPVTEKLLMFCTIFLIDFGNFEENQD